MTPIPFSTQRSLATAQLTRNTFKEVLESRTPFREAALESFRRRNAFLDGVFYDIGKVTHEEAVGTAPWLACEGAILIVPPSGGGSLQLCTTVDEFAAAGGRDIRILAVAGVGSSALGAAAFARNVADAFETTVAAVVSGYGLADLLTEALGGWFWFGALNRLRHQFEVLDAISRAPNQPESVSSSDTSMKSRPHQSRHKNRYRIACGSSLQLLAGNWAFQRQSGDLGSAFRIREPGFRPTY
jgi:hypothetical protein